ncbi:hypothetical protein LV84_02553 [Algoriphagus ratkowskyi]|uniref:Outer membrane protein with beta-barrel domain n=1 Tax=Algoriphagus ratkowskyi TaxID=57028 RepID=A0A2W7RWY4_9BACT|nr:hypothetical protein [Algoriphagus ratkowskyi]PZX55415.1 hypothetical protein LV84_02553 [Algoriphagus ratkowskyi]TXD79661.1 hypothetical protein ESW18_00585 [Algoriphagus ratkowskyi]
MKIQLSLISIFFFASLTLSHAQRYGTAVGLRFGNSNLYRTVGFTAQQRIAKELTVEGILQSDFKLNTTFTALLEKHRPIISKRFNYYYGVGATFGVEESFVKEPESNQILHTYGNSTVGVDLIGGVELTLLNAVISLDYKPNVNIAGREEFYRGQVGISARMVLVKSKEQKKKQRQRQKAKNKSQKIPLNEQFNSIFKKKN